MSYTATISGHRNRVPSSARNLTLRVACTVAEIERLREFWVPWQEHPNSVIDYYLSQFTQDNPDSQPYVMAVCRAGKPDCLLIGKQLPRGVSSAVSTLLQPARRVLYFIEGGLVGNPSRENCEFLVRQIIGQLRRGESDAAEFFGLRVDSSLYQAALRVPNFLCRDHFPVPITHRYLLLPDSFQDFLGSLPAKERQNINYRRRRLLKSFPGKVRVRRFRKEDDVECLIRDAEEIAGKAYQRALGRGFKLDQGPGLRAESRNGSLRGYILYIEEKPAALLIASWQKGVLYGTYAGHDPKYAEYAPGRFLLMCCIEDCFAPGGGEKTVMLDPGVGNQPYKLLFTNLERREAHIAIHPPTLRGAICNLVRTARNFAAHCVKAALTKTRLFPLLQKIRRNRAVRRWRLNEAAARGRLPHDQMD